MVAMRPNSSHLSPPHLSTLTVWTDQLGTYNPDTAVPRTVHVAFDPHVGAIAMAPPNNGQWAKQDAQELRRLHRGRLQVCRRSPFLHANFNLAQHKQAMQAAKERLTYRKLCYSMAVIERRQTEQGRTFPLPGPALHPAFGGREFSSNRSAVLLEPTVFVPTFYKRKDPGHIADWPSRSEMKYEGDDRISTDILHSRFPPAPRIIVNGTVNWQQRTIIVPEILDNFYPSLHELDIMVRSNRIPGREFTDEEGTVTLGAELMGILECEDVYL